MRDWRLQSPVKIIEKVKTMLLAERTGAEWEILEGNEWEKEEGQAEALVHHVGNLGKIPRIEETGVLVPGQVEVGEEFVGDGNRILRIEDTGVLVPGHAKTIGTGGAEQDDGEGGEKVEEKRKGKSKWMKHKNQFDY